MTIVLNILMLACLMIQHQTFSLSFEIIKTVFQVSLGAGVFYIVVFVACDLTTGVYFFMKVNNLDRGGSKKPKGGKISGQFVVIYL